MSTIDNPNQTTSQSPTSQSQTAQSFTGQSLALHDTTATADPAATKPAATKPTTTTAATAGTSRRNRLQTRDLISVGVYTVLYLVVISIGALITHLIPVGMPFTGFICGLLGTTPLMLLMAKTPRFGAISIMGCLLAVLMGGVHGNYYTVATSIIAAVIADVIATRAATTANATNTSTATTTPNTTATTPNHRKRRTGTTLATAAVFNLWNIGMFLPFYIGRSSYLQQLAASRGAEYANRLAGLFPAWTLPVVLVLGIVGGVLGALIGFGLLRRHFQRAGLV
ncbi:MptD family putative ECF transporter S component [Pseudoscardovia suis]|uniref:Putative bacterial integral membrane protein n=1 Tax=Pseudoscardovia suis TaxID=987063 RepID=A0A261EYH3_9BIFI|nr:MptD family putative ECF transporter S component [Pseudoscardovia suis]OZG51887.1 putative bacterial integral membrane protein [Pseudoscardovia suis]PJJ69514.1 energy-coupling factor transport system substrate-specific component [Pseudoscardovia suis]